MYEPPKGLKEPGAALWQATVADVAEGWALDSRDLAVLEQACRLRDAAAALERRVGRMGVMTTGSKGQPTLNPCVRELRVTRLAIASALGKVELRPPRQGTRHLSKRGRDQLADARRQRWPRAGS